MFPDDVFRKHLAEAITSLDAWAVSNKDAARIDIDNSDAYWKMAVAPHEPRACAFELLFNAHQQFSLALDHEVYEDRPIDRFDFFPMLARAIAIGDIERIKTFNAMTDALEMIEMRVELEDGWAWIGERRIGPRPPRRLEVTSLRRTERYLPYRR